jgi:NarL family two-component system sensor histidine kinase YdfH
MNKLRAFIARAISPWGSEAEWPFMLFLTFVFVLVYIWTVLSSTRVREPVLLTTFSILFVIHLIFHWIILWWLKKNWNTWLYLGIQAAIVVTLVSLAGELGPMIGLYLGLIGEAVGLFRGSWMKKGLAIAGLLTLSAITSYWVLPEGQILWWAIAILPMTVFVIIYVVLYSRQADARIKAQELLAELETANLRLTESAGQIEDLTLANERQRMARELHDTLAQGLAGLILQLEAADLHLGRGHAERAQTIVQQAMTRARATLAESRRAIDGLRRESSGGLAEALKIEADHFTAAAGIPCDLDLAVMEAVPDTTRELILRAVSEGLTNIARHARAAHASIKVRGTGRDFEVEITDDGAGFTAEAGMEPQGHYGLIGLRERAQLAGGTLEIESRPARGTTLRVHIPPPQT